MNFYTLFLEQPAGLIENVILRDKKLFVLNKRPNHKNDGRCSTEIPQEVVRTNERNDKKVMMFVTIVYGDIPIMHAFDKEDGKTHSINGTCYLEILQEFVCAPLLLGAMVSDPFNNWIECYTNLQTYATMIMSFIHVM